MRRAAATSSYVVDFRRPRPTPLPEPVGRAPRVTRLLALAHRIDAMIRAGEIEDLATAARLCRVTRARMTQIMNLTLLAPGLQEAILDMPPVAKGRDLITERNLREIVAEVDWERQVAMWRDTTALVPSRPTSDSRTGGTLSGAANP